MGEETRRGPVSVRTNHALAIGLAALLPFHALAQDAPNHYNEPGINPNREYVNQHFAEQIDPFSGNLQLHYVDVFLPGNGGFDLKVQRSYNVLKVGDNYSPYGRGWDMHFGRVKHRTNQPACNWSTSAAQSLVLETPDGSQQTFYKSSGVAGTSINSDFITTRFWKGQCDSGSGGMVVYAPDGMRYDMTTADNGYWLVSRITDRNGNYADFQYVTIATWGRKAVSSVSASDGRTIYFSYSSDRLYSISAGVRTWSYTVSAAGSSFTLTQVNPPAGGSWQYAYYADRGLTAGSFALQRLTYPQGGQISYDYDYINFLPGVLPAQQSTVVKSKSTSDGSWSFAYLPSSGIGSYDRTTVTQPSGIGSIVYLHFGYNTISQGEVWKIGLLYQKSLGSEQTETFIWDKALISNEDTVKPGYFKFDTDIYRPLSASHFVARNGGSFSTAYSSFDLYGNPQSISETGNKSRTRSISYFNSGPKWIIGLSSSDTISGAGTISRGYDAYGNLTSESKFGVNTAYTYYADGTLHTKTNARNNTTTFSSYYRGIPQSESRPEGVSISRIVDTFGNVTSESDGVSTWGYGYDGLNRITSIIYPIGSNATISWYTLSRTLTRGAFSETKNFDTYGRTTSVVRNAITTSFTHDALGRKTFESYPGASAGTTFYYDVLGRITSSTSPAGTKSYSYAGYSVTVSNERSQSTTYSYDRYGNPDDGYLSYLNSPASTAVTISRDSIGLMGSVTQGGITRSYGYNSNKFLTSITEPETGTTTFGRDAVGNMISKTVGTATITYTYDNLDRLKTIGYGGTAGTVAYIYNNRGQVTDVNNPTALRHYVYDANGGLTEDNLTVDGQVFITGYGRDTIDNLASVTYPMNKGTISYAPDGLGRPTKALPYINSVSHFSSGNLNVITYANGVSMSLGENSRQLPSSISASTVNLSLNYTYDGVGNVDTLNIFNGATENRTFGYDGADRLTSASGSWGNGTFSYSNDGNITKQQLGTYQLNYSYTSGNRLTSISGSKALNFAYDGLGNTTGYGPNAFTYDQASSLTCVNCGAANQNKYGYDGKGQRVFEEKAGNKTYFVQGPGGDLLFEYTSYGKAWKKHAHLHGKRIATETGSDATATTIIASATPSPGVVGVPVTLRATVLPSTATGAVTFFDGTLNLGTATLASGQATLAVSNLTGGSHTINAKYSGDANNQPSTGTFTLVVNKYTASVALSALPASGPLGQIATLSATVTGSSPSGQVQFKDGANVIGTVTLTNGTAGFTTAALGAGLHNFTADYSGDGNNTTASSAQAPVTISQGTATVTLTTTNPSISAGQAVTLNLLVAGTPSFVPTGSATFKDGATVLSTGALIAGARTIGVNTFVAGTHQLTAEYAGDGNYPAAVSAAVTQVVAQAASSTSLSVTSALITPGQDVTYTASVTGYNPTGLVRFLDNSVQVASGSLSNGSATAVVQIGAGTHVLKAVYDGDVNNTASASADVTRTVDPLALAYLASTGSDASPCNLAAPCRLLPRAIAAVADGAEIRLLSSANYNIATVAIAKSVTIIAVPGVLGSVVATGGNAIDIATAGAKVALRNLMIVPLPGAGGTGGINMISGAGLTVENCLIANLPGTGINVNTATSVRVTNTIIRGNGANGLALQGGAHATVTRAMIGENVGHGVLVYGSVAGGTTTADIADSTVDANFHGVVAYSDNASAAVKVSARDSRTVRNANYGMVSQSTAGASVTLSASNNVISNNNGGITAASAGSKVWMSGNTVSDNSTYGLYNSGGLFESVGDNAVRNNGTNASGTITQAVSP
jgi:YD repeat-containing protein